MKAQFLHFSENNRFSFRKTESIISLPIPVNFNITNTKKHSERIFFTYFGTVNINSMKYTPTNLYYVRSIFLGIDR